MEFYEREFCHKWIKYLKIAENVFSSTINFYVPLEQNWLVKYAISNIRVRKKICPLSFPLSWDTDLKINEYFFSILLKNVRKKHLTGWCGSRIKTYYPHAAFGPEEDCECFYGILAHCIYVSFGENHRKLPKARLTNAS